MSHILSADNSLVIGNAWEVDIPSRTSSRPNGKFNWKRVAVKVKLKVKIKRKQFV